MKPTFEDARWDRMKKSMKSLTVALEQSQSNLRAVREDRDRERIRADENATAGEQWKAELAKAERRHEKAVEEYKTLKTRCTFLECENARLLGYQERVREDDLMRQHIAAGTVAGHG